ncbi:MAG: hypothetical protein HWN68_13735 [Desulfobacterales bacterium]|nr:hypothetical protein [Desulfobacterales bacterium]
MMENTELLSDANIDNLAAQLVELLKVEVEFSFTVPRTNHVGTHDLASVKDKLKEWLKKVSEIAREFGPKEFSIQGGVGFTPGLYASFTWPLSLKESEGDKP